MGRDYLGAGEIRRMTMSENIVRAYFAANRSPNWAEWAAENPWQAGILGSAKKAAMTDGD